VTGTTIVVSTINPNLEPLKSIPYPQVIKGLNAIKGIGDKTANCVALFSLEKLNAFPVDSNIYAALNDWYGKKAGVPDVTLSRGDAATREVRKWAQLKFGSYAGYASQFLFIDHYLRNNP
jgi:N-glycosylase/DNA lyase